MEEEDIAARLEVVLANKINETRHSFARIHRIQQDAFGAGSEECDLIRGEFPKGDDSICLPLRMPSLLKREAHTMS